MRIFTLIPFGNNSPLNFKFMKKLNSSFSVLFCLKVLIITSVLSASIHAQSPLILSKGELQANINNRVNDPNLKNVETLLFSNQQSVHFSGGKIVSNSKRPISIFSDVLSLNQIYSIENKGIIESINVHLKSKADLTQLRALNNMHSFPRLKVIKLNFEFDVNQNDFSNLIQYHEDFSWIVVYEVIKPS